MRRRINQATLTVLALTLLTGCPSDTGDGAGPNASGGQNGGGPKTPTSAPAIAKPPPPASAPAEAVPAGVTSNDGAFYVTYAFEPDPLPLNEVYGLTVTVFDGEDHTRRLDDVELDIDGRMPMHRHGMNREPKVVRNADGSFTVTGMLFHMPGAWEMYFDVTQDGITERAQVGIDLE